MRSIKDFKPDNTGSGEKATDISKKYAGLDRDELMQELIKSVSSAKSDGTFSTEQLDEFVGFVAPSLDEQSLKRLKELVELIKNT